MGSMLYIHIPYCKGKCIYCDFYSAGRIDWQRYLKTLIREFSIRKDELGECLSSIYVGGGTPSLSPEMDFKNFTDNLFKIIKEKGVVLDSDFEFTIEVNPEDVNLSKITAWKEAGINRVSMGIQTLDDELLRFLHRRHDSRKALEACGLLADNFSNFSLDFIYGIPDQTVDSLLDSVRKTLIFGPKHISTYSLTFEEKTPLGLMLRQGRVKEQEEEAYLRMDNELAQLLDAEGFERYEISNYAKPGFRSRHNSGYWHDKPYLGLGPAASSYDGFDVRRINPSNLKDYMDWFDSARPKGPFYKEEVLSREEKLEEHVMVSLRCREGISLTRFEERFSKEARDILLEKSDKFLKSNDLILDGDSLQLSQKGIAISDYIILSLI